MANQTQAAQQRVVDEPRHDGGDRRTPEPAGRIERRVIVPLVDRPASDRVVYHSSLLWFALAGGLLAAVAGGLVAWLMATGLWPVSGLGQFSAGGVGVATFTGAGIGLALGATSGGILAVYRLERPVES